MLLPPGLKNQLWKVQKYLIYIPGEINDNPELNHLQYFLFKIPLSDDDKKLAVLQSAINFSPRKKLLRITEYYHCN